MNSDPVNKLQVQAMECFVEFFIIVDFFLSRHLNNKILNQILLVEMNKIVVKQENKIINPT